MQDDPITQADTYIMNTYGRLPVVLVRGRGSRVWDSEGREYLDFLAGIAVCSLGHCHPRVTEAVKRQADVLWHVSNIYYIEPQARLARLLVEHSFADRAFFCNSGAEANEAAIKLARKYGNERGRGGRFEIITMKNSFHGRTLATVTATGQEKFHRGFDPLPVGFRYAAYDDISALEHALTDKTCAVLVEPIQGEGGVRVPSEGYLGDLRKFCDEHELLLILDEVQTGMGRTGSLFAYEQSGIEPDIMTLAKALGNGFPLGAMLARENVASCFEPGNHATTFGGNPLAMAAGIAVMETLLDENIPAQCREMGDYFRGELEKLKNRRSVIRDVRGRGLMVGVELAVEGGGMVRACLERGVLINCTCGNVLRLVPPLIVSGDDIDRVVNVLDEVMMDYE
ncbi:MAG: acetylornithine transaminase [Deltaproteobacteria bacterium]|nr:acetylornithine transaminase [Deltaproteobacteria bacterium]